MSEGASGGKGTLTEEEAVRLYRASIETFNQHGIEAWLGTCTDDLRVKTVEDFPGGGTFEGKEAVREFMKQFTEAWDLARYETSEERVVNGRVIARSSWKVRGRSSGAETILDFFAVASLRDDLLSSLILDSTEQEALAVARAS